MHRRLETPEGGMPHFLKPPPQPIEEEGPRNVTAATRVFVQRQYREGGAVTGEEEERDDLVEVHVFATEPARANAEISRTVNLGDYESVRVQVGVSLPCYKEEIGPALEEASAIAGGFLDRELKGLGLKGLA